MDSASINKVSESEKIISSEYAYSFIYPEEHNIHKGDVSTFKNALLSGAFPIPQFSFYPNSHCTKIEDAKIKNIIQVARIMRSNKIAMISKEIYTARQNENIELVKKLKRFHLPCITHTGIFIPRCNAGLQFPSFTFQLDIDKIKNPSKILDQIIIDQKLEVLIASISVSGNGVKAILFLRELALLKDLWSWEDYRFVYRQATEILNQYFKENYGVEIDQQMKSISQPFFLFHSPDLWINKNYIPWI